MTERRDRYGIRIAAMRAGIRLFPRRRTGRRNGISGVGDPFMPIRRRDHDARRVAAGAGLRHGARRRAGRLLPRCLAPAVPQSRYHSVFKDLTAARADAEDKSVRQTGRRGTALRNCMPVLFAHLRRRVLPHRIEGEMRRREGNVSVRIRPFDFLDLTFFVDVADINGVDIVAIF